MYKASTALPIKAVNSIASQVVRERRTAIKVITQDLFSKKSELKIPTSFFFPATMNWVLFLFKTIRQRRH